MQFSHHEFTSVALGNTLMHSLHKVLLSSSPLLPNPKLYQGNKSKNNHKTRLKLKRQQRGLGKETSSSKEGEVIVIGKPEKNSLGENISNI